MDYVTAIGITKRTGYAKKHSHLFCLKEFLDNASDFLENYYKGANDASIIVNIKKEDSLLHIAVRNSNKRNIPVFANLKATFDYNMFFGSKRNQYKTSRGALGDAMKEILAIPYALMNTIDDGMTKFTDNEWTEPLIIRHSNKEFKIYLQVDKVSETIDAKIEESLQQLDENYTEVELVLPIIDEIKNYDLMSHLEEYCYEYALFSTHIAFKISLTDGKMAREIDLPAYHPIASDSSNTNSIYFYRPGEFKDFILSLDDKTMSMYDALRKTFREGSNMKKTILNSEMTVADLISSPDIERAELLERFYNELMDAMPPPTKLSLPYDIRKRKDALIDRIGKRYDIDKTKVKHKLIHGHYNDDALAYPFVFEIAAVPLASVLRSRNGQIYRWC